MKPPAKRLEFLGDPPSPDPRYVIWLDVERPGPGNLTELPCGCKETDLGYNDWHADAARRAKAGQRQVVCRRCGKWSWPDLAGPHCMTEREHKRMIREIQKMPLEKLKEMTSVEAQKKWRKP